MPLVSVLIPTYNYAHFLDEAIASVLQQTFQDFEIIIVDNHSTDNTEGVVRKYLNDSRIRYFRNASNLGLTGNFNKCLEYVRGKYIKYLLADDKFHPQLLEKYVAIMDQNPGVSLVTCDRAIFGDHTTVVRMPFMGLQKGEDIIRHTLHTFGWIGEPTCIMFRSENLFLGKFNPKFTWIVDWELWIRHLTVGDLYIIPEPLAYIRDHQNQVSKTVMKKYIHYFEAYTFYRLVQKNKKIAEKLTFGELRKLCKTKARNCSKLAFKMFFKLHKNECRQVFVKSLKIAVTERVVFDPLLAFAYNQTKGFIMRIRL